jgi:hypothetical protein
MAKAASIWSSGRSRWLLGAVLLGLIIPLVFQFVVTRTDAYRLAVTTAHGTPKFREALGLPIREGWFSGGNREFGNPSTAALTIPVSGSRRKGNLRALAIKENGRWRLEELVLELAEPDEHIDLLSKAPL